MKKTLNTILLLMTLALILSACGKTSGGNSGGTTKSTTQAATTVATTEATTEDTSPKTAAQPAALTKKDLPNPLVGEEAEIFWGEEDCEVLLDQGGDGHTLTRNGFDKKGNLLWWEAFEYDLKENALKGITKDPQGQLLRWREFLYDKKGNRIGVKVHDAKDVLRAEYEFSDSSGKLKALSLFDEKGIQQRLTQYDFDGNETYVAEYDQKGQLLKEYEYGFRKLDFPQTATDMMIFLNGTVEEDFEEIYAACMHYTEKTSSRQKEWEEICATLSATLDYMGTPMQELYEKYHLCKSITSDGYDEMRQLIDDGLNPLLREKVYQEGCSLKYGRTAWLSDLLEAALPEEYPEYVEGSALHVLYVDTSKVIGVPGPGFTDMTKDNLEDKDTAKAVRDRMNDILNGVFDPYGTGLIIIEADPTKADIILEVKTSYKFKATYYYKDGDPADVYSTYVNVKAKDVRSDKTAKVEFKIIPGDTLYGSGRVIWMSIPDFEDDPYRSDANKFVDGFLAWYGLARKK